MIVITGAAGFIGSCLVGYFNRKNTDDLLLVDDFSRPEKLQNFEDKSFQSKIDREAFPSWFSEHANKVDFVFHLGARTDTTEKDTRIFDHLNLNYSKAIWEICADHDIPLVYASSAATYGLGELSFDDEDEELPEKLKPLNPYGVSKNEFDKWALQQSRQPPFWYGLKFFNAYGPNEYHKGRMASVVLHAYNQIAEKGSVKLFRSHRDDIKDGEQARDFIYVKDVVRICDFFRGTHPESGIYNIGTGKARFFKDLAKAIFISMNKPVEIKYIDTPQDIRDTYQYFTEAKMDKLRAAGYGQPFYSLEDGVKDYVTNYLVPGKIY